MSMTKRIFALLLTVAMLVSVLTACNKPQTPDQTTETTTPDPNPLPNPPETPAKKITSVKVSCGESPIENFAATELKWYLAKRNIPLTEDGYHISFIIDERVTEGGYRITADENSLTVMGGDNRGLAYGLYGFLEKFIGVHFYSPETTAIDDGDLMIGGGVLEVFDPAFDILRNPWAPIENLPQKDGGNDEAATGITKTIALTTVAGTGNIRPCLTDPKIFTKAVQNIQNYLSAAPDIDIISFTPKTDYDLYCTCENCARVHEEEGSPAGNYVRFLNKLYEEISVDYPNLQFELVIRAYLVTAPTVTKPVDGISIRFSTASCHISHPLNDTTCPEAASFAEKVRNWGSICDNVRVEYALTSTTDFIPVFANLGAMRENMRFFAECGVDSIFFSGNIVCPSGEFGELRVYLASKLAQDPLMSEEEYYGYMDSFLKAFYGEGWEYIRKFIDKIIELSADGHQMVDGSPFDAITKDEYLANEATFDEWWNKAEELAGDRIDFVKRGRYQWRYIKLCLHPNATDAQALITDAASNPRVGWRDKQWNVDTASSNLDLAPTEWIYKS